MKKDITGYEGLYQIEINGTVHRLTGSVPHKTKGKVTIQHRILKNKKTRLGYYAVTISKDGIKKTHLIHRLIAQAFIPNPENKPDINHRNGIKGDFSIENLEWCTKKENIQHAVKTGLKKPSGACLLKGENNHKSKLNWVSVRVIREAAESGHSNRDISNYFKVSRNQISLIKRRLNWKTV
jgi:hypothetical protein